jgi:hypothetical protein
LARDRDVRDAIQTALKATGAFDSVYLWGLPEDYGSGASQLALAVIEPVSSAQADLWDSQTAGGLEVTSTVAITFLARNDDPQLRDEAVEDLFDLSANALNGADLVAGFTEPAQTKFTSWRWLAPTAPERRIATTFMYRYIVPSWEGYDTTA